jgi:hypothetical protein
MSYQSGDGAAAGTYHQPRQRAKSAGTPAARGGTCATQDQLQLNGTAARLRPDLIRTRPRRSRRHGQRSGLSPHVVRTPRIGGCEPQAGRESWPLAARPWAAVPRLPLSGLRPHQPGSGIENAQVAPGRHRSLDSERGLATPSPDGKGEIALGPSMKIMPVDPYNMLGRSCEPAYQVDCRREAARRRHAPASAPGRRDELLGHLAGKLTQGPGPDPVTDGRGRGVPAHPEAPELRYSPAR